MAEATGGPHGYQVFLAAEDVPRLGPTLREVVAIAVPNIVGYLMALINELTNTVVIGHAGSKAALAAIGLANMMQNCFGLSVGFGIAGALDTLVSQAHGAQQHELACQQMQRARVLITLQLVWMVPLLWFSGEWLALIHQDPEVARDAGEYNRASVWGLFAAFQFEVTRKFLQNRGYATPPAVICAGTAVLHIGWCGFFVLYLKMGNAGAGYANAVTWWTQFIVGSVYLFFTSRRDGLRRRSVLWIEGPGWREWGQYMKLAVPATVQLCSEWWFWEICALFVGYLGEVALAAHVATLSWVGFVFMPAIGINASTAMLVGNALGANHPRKARYIAWVCVGVNVVVWTAIAAGTVACRGVVARAFCPEDDVRALMETLLCIFAGAGYFDSTQNVMGGALRGIGKTSLSAIVYIVSYYAVMLPGGIVAAFPLGLGVQGIWGAMCVGTAIAMAIFAVALARADYRKLAAEAATQMERQGHEAKRAADAAGLAREVAASALPAEGLVGGA